MKAPGNLLRFRRPSAALLLPALLLFLSGCANLPDTRPFTEATGSLRSAVASGGSATVAELVRIDTPGASAAAANLASAWAERDRTFSALTTYAGSLEAIVDSGRSGAAAVNDLADAVTQFRALACVAAPKAHDGL